MDWGTAPQWITAVVAIVAGIIAIASIHTQRDIARKRASLDLFLKTSTDATVTQMAKGYAEVFKKFNDPKRPPGPVMAEPEDQSAIILYLGIFELIAVGIHNGVLDERVCFEFWGDPVIEKYKESRGFIEGFRKAHDSRFLFIDFEDLSKWWEVNRKQMIDANLRHPKLKKPYWSSSAPSS